MNYRRRNGKRIIKLNNLQAILTPTTASRMQVSIYQALGNKGGHYNSKATLEIDLNDDSVAFFEALRDMMQEIAKEVKK